MHALASRRPVPGVSGPPPDPNECGPRRRLGKAALLAAGVVSLAALAAAPAPAAAEGEATLRLELNRLEGRDNGACRFWFVANNATPEAIDPLRIDLILFGRDAVILRRLAVDLGPLPASRTTVRIFDVAGQACEGIGQLLLNDVLACGAAGAAQRPGCAERIALSSRAAGIELMK
jgi:hypothetical protein